MLDKVRMVNGLKYPEFLGHALEGLVVVVLQGDLLHGHDVARLVVDGGVHLAEVPLTNLDASLPRKFDLSGSNMNLVLGHHLVQHFPCHVNMRHGTD